MGPGSSRKTNIERHFCASYGLNTKKRTFLKKKNETEYNALQKAKRNAEYLAMLDRSEEELKAGKVAVKTMEELEAMEN